MSYNRCSAINLNRDLSCHGRQWGITMLLPACRNLLVFARRAFLLVMIVSLGTAWPCCFAQENCVAAEKEKPPASTPAVPNDVSKELLAEFRRTYALPDDQVIKRVAPPFSPGRLEFYRVREPAQAQAIPKPPNCMWFGWGDPTTGYDQTREGKLHGGAGSLTTTLATLSAPLPTSMAMRCSAIKNSSRGTSRATGSSAMAFLPKNCFQNWEPSCGRSARCPSASD